MYHLQLAVYLHVCTTGKYCCEDDNYGFLPFLHLAQPMLTPDNVSYSCSLLFPLSVTVSLSLGNKFSGRCVEGFQLLNFN